MNIPNITAVDLESSSTEEFKPDGFREWMKKKVITYCPETYTKPCFLKATSIIGLFNFLSLSALVSCLFLQDEELKLHLSSIGGPVFIGSLVLQGANFVSYKYPLKREG